MTTPDQSEAARQISLCEKRQHMIEAGQIKSCQPLPGDPPTGALMTANDLCPNCQNKMVWHIGRQAFLCWRCQ